MTSSDLASVLALLEAHQLPTQGVADGAAVFFVARAKGRVIGSAGIETYGAAGLLRSVAVHEDRRNEGIATALVRHVLAHAAHAQLTAIYLLTTSAPEYFRSFGFQDCARSGAPEGIRDSWEFRAGCPSSAVFLCRRVSGS